MLESLARRWVLKSRIHPVAPGSVPNPYSLEHLYLVQQKKRLSLSASFGRLRPGNLLQIPVILPVVAFKAFDLWIANQVICAMINEWDLLQRTRAQDEPSG